MSAESGGHFAEYDGVEDDGPECETCGKTTCPDADLPGFSVPRQCAFAPLFHAFRDAVDCDYGCGRDLTNAGIRRGVVRAVEALVSEFKADGVREAADALYLTRSGQVHEEAKNWLHRRANLIDPRTRNEVCEHGNPPESDCALCATKRATSPGAPE